MFERYTENARRVIFFARYEASQSASPAIEPEHILLGLLRDNGDLLVRLTRAADPAGAIRKSVVERRAPPRQMISTSVELPLALGTKDVLMKAFEETRALGHGHIGPEHLLLGLLANGESVAAEALRTSGITAEGIRDLVGGAGWATPFSKPTLPAQLKRSILECLDETFVEVHGMYLDRGCSLFPTLEGVSAQEASGSVSPDSATLAAQVEHVRFYLDVLNDVIRSKQIVKVDWKKIWDTVSQVTPEEWEEQKRRLRESYARVVNTLESIDGWDGEHEITGALSVLSHTGLTIWVGSVRLWQRSSRQEANQRTDR